MRLAYIAGPYRGGSINSTYENIQKAREVGVELAKLGLFPIIPHCNTAFMDGVQSNEFWLDGDLRLMSYCDLVVLLPNWFDSTGAVKEREVALKLAKPVYYWPGCEGKLRELVQERVVEVDMD